MIRRGVFLLCMLALSTLPLAAKAVSWKAYSDAAGRFSVTFPGMLKTATQQNDSPLGQITTHLYTSPCPYGTFTLTYSDLPSIAASFAEGKAFDGARDGLLNDAKATAVSYTDWQHGEDDAKVLVYQGRLSGKAWLVMVGSRLYVLDARVKKGTRAAQVDPFFNSFKTISR